jgi:uncharacterized OB-fold protein
MPTKARLYSFYDEPMWESIAHDAMQLQKCSDCGAIRYPPGPTCPKCLSTDYAWTPIEGRGRVLSWTTFHRQYLPAYPPPRTVVAVQLSEGSIMVGHVAADQVKRLKVDAPVRMIYVDHADGYRIPSFEAV